MTAYRKSMKESLAEVRNLQEDNMDLMRKAAGKGGMQTIKMKDGKLKMDKVTASAIMQIFDKLNPANQKKMQQMINGGKKSGIIKLSDFAMSKVTGFKSEEVELDEKEVWDKPMTEDEKEGKLTSAQKAKAKARAKAAGRKYPNMIDNMWASNEEFELDEAREKTVRQLIDPKREVMVVKKNKVVVIDKKDEDKYLKQGWELAEQNEAYELGTDEYREYLEKLTPGEMDEASARADAKSAMRKGREVDPADVDTDATDDDIKGASKNIIMQMRKAVSLRGNFPVEFGDGKKVKIPAKVGQAVQDKYNSLKKPADKEKFQAQVAKSYKDMLKVLKAGYMMKAAYEEVEIEESSVEFQDHDASDKDFIKLMKNHGLKAKSDGDDTVVTGDAKSIEKVLQTMYGNDWKKMYKVKGDKYVEEEVELDEMSPKDKILKKTSDHLHALIKGSNLPDDNAAFSAV